MTKEEFLSIAEGYYAEFESLKEEPTLYDYEKSLFELTKHLSNSLMEKHLNEGSVTQNRRKKNLDPIRRNLCIKVPQVHERSQTRLWY